MKRYSANARAIVRATPTTVFNAFVNAETMSKFWFMRRDDGLQEGASVSWYVGKSDDAYAIEVRVKELKKPELIRVDWCGGDHFSQVLWRMQETEEGHTLLTIEEIGFYGSEEQVISQVLDSTAGFNQVIIALKALVEHDTIINVVEDHA